MKKAPILWCTFLHQCLDFKISHYTQPPFKNKVGYKKIQTLLNECAQQFLHFFWFYSFPKILYLGRALTFQIFICIPKKPLHHNLVYYDIYHE